MGEEGVSPKQRMAQAKHKIKTWEGDYKATHGCAPDREAMTQAPEDIRHAYKTYRYYRKAAADHTSSCSGSRKSSSLGEEEGVSRSSSGDVGDRVCVPCSDDPVTSTDTAQGEGSTGHQAGGGGVPDPAVVLTHDLESCPVGERKDVSDNSSCETKNSQAPATVGHSESAGKFANTFTSAWGKHLNKSNYCPPKVKEPPKETSLYSKMAEKLRANSTINMRKSLSRTSSLKRSQSKSLLSRSLSQSSVCNESHDGSSESRTSCNSESSFDQVKPSEEETSHHTNTSTTDINEVFSTSFHNTVDELAPLSMFDAVEPSCDRTLTSSLNNTSDELRPFSILDATEPNSCRTPSIHKNISKPRSISALDAMELDSLEKIPKFHEITTSRRAPITQPISVLSALGQTHTSGLPGVKKRSSLNLGWVARCTGTPLDHTVTSKQAVPQDDWKIRLIDKDWSEGNDEDEETQESPPVQQAINNPVPPTRTYNSKPVKNTVKKAVKNPRKKPVKNTTAKGTKKKAAPIKEIDTSLPTQNKEGRVLRTRSTRNAPKPDYIDFSDDDVDSVGGGSLQSQGGKRRGLSVEEDDLWQDSGEREESEGDLEAEERMSNFADEEPVTIEQEPFGEGVCVRKRKKETIEELEEKGKIQSQWPPPKKKRVAREKAVTVGARKKALTGGAREKAVTVSARKKAVTGGNIKKIGKENSPKKKRPVRKRKNIEPEEEEEENEEEVDSPGIPPQPSKGLLNLDYDETDDIESHGAKITKSKGRGYLTGEERMRKKVSSGTLNQNFVRINLKKKVFVRGKKTMTGEKFKRQEWKKKQMFKSAEAGNAGAMKNLTCFKCGDFGHWARMCPGKRGDNLTPLESYDENESSFLSLDEAASMALGIKKVDSDKPVSKLYRAPQESKDGDEGKVDGSNGDGIDASHTPPDSQQEPTEAEEKESEAINNEDQTVEKIQTEKDEDEPLPGNITQEEDVDAGEDGTEKETQNTNVQQKSNEEEYDFKDSDDDMFGNLDEADFVEQEPKPASSTASTQNTSSVTAPPNAPPSQSTYWQERPTVEPLYSLDDGEVIATPEEVHEALRMFGYPSFRPGQEEAIMRILSGQSTLLVLSTGSGKSLCYQLPAYLYSKHRSPCITLCVSPLVSLMEDQTMRLPNFLRAVCLHTHQNQTQRSHALTAIHSRVANILLVSPEAVVASRTGGVLGTLLKELPPVAFACLDEAHCVSEWSHNFRPSYLRVCQVLRERLGVKTILGLTATARTSTAVSIARHLLITKFDTGVIRGTSVPDNLQLSVSRDRNRAVALVTLLGGERFSECSSIIIYCTRRDECERVATLIRTQLLDPSKVDVKSNLKRNRGMSFDAEAYHAGLSSHRRHMVQKKFMSGQLRIVVATVAFGMGIDKSDVRGIIHFNMPRNVESYVQEIGRAGRDGKEAHCHLFLDDQDGRDIQELKRHIFANSLDRHTIRKLLNKIFKPCTCAKLKSLGSDGNEEDDDICSAMPSSPGCSSSTTGDGGGMMCSGASSDPFSVATTSSTCPRHEVAIPVDAVVEELDLPAENLETLLCYLELHQKNLIHINSHVYANCTVSCYGGPRQLVAVSRKCPPLAIAIALERQKGVDFSRSNRVSFPVVEIASRMGWNSKIVKRELKSLEWNTQALQSGGNVKRSGVVVEMTDLSFHLEARGDLSDDERDQVLDAVYRRTQVQEQDQLRQLHYTYQLLRSVSHSTIMFCCDSIDEERCNRLRTELREYFRCNEALAEVHIEDKASVKPEVDCSIRSSVRSFLSTYEEQQWTGRAVARVFHGIGSPNYPTETWGRVRRYWRQHLDTDFNALVSIATQEILRFK